MDTGIVWSEKLKSYLPSLMGEQPILAEFADRAAILLHGSTCRGVDDPFSDLDLYVLLRAGDLAEFDRRSPIRFYEFDLDGKPGHWVAYALEELTARVDRCDMALISELRTSIALYDRLDGASELMASAKSPMRPEVRRAFFFYNYYQMRNFHRASDNPMERGDGLAVLFSLSQTIAYALRAALILDGEPYPYEKWLRREALRQPTGEKLAPHVDAILDAIAGDALRLAGPDRQNPLSQQAREMRQILIHAARANGIDEPWLIQWWLYISQAEAATARVRWQSHVKLKSNG
jgi:predicted nucleotidyltransferase